MHRCNEKKAAPSFDESTRLTQRQVREAENDERSSNRKCDHVRNIFSAGKPENFRKCTCLENCQREIQVAINCNGALFSTRQPPRGVCVNHRLLPRPRAIPPLHLRVEVQLELTTLLARFDPFSTVPKPILASKYSPCHIFGDLHIIVLTR